jgi:hypothetical protein
MRSDSSRFDMQCREQNAMAARRRPFELRRQVTAHPTRQACQRPSLYRLADADETREEAAAINEALYRAGTAG